MAKVTKKMAPSRIKYEAGNPTVTCRVSKEIYDRLKAVKKAEGKSVADILKIGLGIVEPSLKKAAEARQQGWKEGHTKGYADAELRYKVTYPCSVCGQSMAVTSVEEKRAIVGYMKGWRHSECPKKTG